VKRDGPSALATRAVKGRGIRLVLGTWDAYATTLDATHLLNQRGTPYKCFAVVSG